ncbi:hypothetical protein GRJ2_001649800 [Grus japonensis]|uniref:Uncharacterized protein n=1 Tax=Grus japonensis TaxID=30415 RepID=A0ABC9X2E1_GRUJA
MQRPAKRGERGPSDDCNDEHSVRQCKPACCRDKSVGISRHVHPVRRDLSCSSAAFFHQDQPMEQEMSITTPFKKGCCSSLKFRMVEANRGYALKTLPGTGGGNQEHLTFSAGMQQ